MRRTPSNSTSCQLVSQFYMFTVRVPPRIKDLDTAAFDVRLRSSMLFTEPADTLDHYRSQLETTVTDVLDDMVPLRLGRRTGGKRVHGGLIRMQPRPNNSDVALNGTEKNR